MHDSGRDAKLLRPMTLVIIDAGKRNETGGLPPLCAQRPARAADDVTDSKKTQERRGRDRDRGIGALELLTRPRYRVPDIVRAHHPYTAAVQGVTSRMKTCTTPQSYALNLKALNTVTQKRRRRAT
jgi:hypothetical protein